MDQAQSAPADRARQIVLAVALIRLAVGAVSTAQDTVLPRSLGIDSATAGRMAFITRMFATREIALALGTGAAVVKGGSGARSWVLASALADGFDAVTLVTAARSGRAAKLGSYAAAAGAVAAVGGALWYAATRR
ncbi:hypothetical protein [Cryptosporangium phraense]|uniref:DUF4267 domain-containing protein n=1 Tax=Cryptosporangium phraense TaxID=2593070 RepID=A0A545AZI9_9ACTN|nr:hypothetical protein [Cryptosporangium phraense]TQS46718.1 hypothetical protein FL583_00090 [Cryptosporangium phraense]